MTNPSSKRQWVEEGPQKPKPLWKKILKFMFSHVGLCFLLFVYVLVGAAIFIGIEGGSKSVVMVRSHAALAEQKDFKNVTIEDLKALKLKPLGTEQENKDQVAKLISDYEKRLSLTADRHGVSVAEALKGATDPWSFSAATLFTVSIITLVGYGNVYPVTTAGMVAVIVYGLIGIPLTLIFLANLGDLMAMVVKKLTGRLRGKFGRGDTVADVGQDAEAKKIGKGQLILLLVFPIFLTITIMVFFMLVGALIFWLMEGWPVLVGVYFCLQTFTTIGFGDYAPGWEETPTAGGAFKQIATVLFIFCGLAFIAMGLNLIADEIIKYSKSVSRKLGWEDEEGQQRKGNIDRAVRRNQNKI